jgi:hypothetical protein
MRKLIILLSIFCISCGLKAQEKMSFKKVDSLSYAYYLEGKWNELAEFGEKSIKEGNEYYYLFLRTGIANYKIGNYYLAEKHLKKGLVSNPNDQLIKEYLYWIYIWRKDYWRADAAHFDLDEETKSWVIHLEKDPLAYWHIGGGVSLSNLSDSADNKSYFEIGAYHKFSTNFAAYQAYSFLSQKLYDGEYSQHQYSIAPNYRLSKRTRLTAAYSYIYNKFDLGFSSTINSSLEFTDGVSTTTEIRSGVANSNGQIISHLNYIELGANIAEGRFIIAPSAGIFIENTNSEYTVQEEGTGSATTLNGGFPIVENYQYSISEIVDRVENQIYFQGIIDVQFTPKFCNDKFTFKLKTYVPISKDQTDILLSPAINYKVSDKIKFGVKYLNKENYFIADGSGTIINNASFVNSKKLGLNLFINIKNNRVLYIVLENEQIEDNLRNIEYNTNNIILGLKF